VPFVTTVGGDVALPAGTETVVMTSLGLVAPAPGNWFPLILGVIAVLLGAVPPTALTIAFKTGGSDVDTMVVAPALLVANATLNLPLYLLGLNSGSLWIGAGQAVQLTALPTGQAATFKFNGSKMIPLLLRGLDA
jgi:hypothetical protein